jgi:hypothetical protein
MKKEQIIKLKEYVISNRKDDETSIVEVLCLIDEWFEQNPIKPMVVWLSDEPLVEFQRAYNASDKECIHEIYKEWAKTQTLAQPEVKEVPVGLSDEQARELLRFYDNSQNESSTRIETYHEWAKTKNFAHYNNEGKVYGLDGSVTDYKADYESVAGSFVSLKEECLKLKAQQWQPNWDDAPDAVSATVFIDYRNEKNVSVRCKDVLAVNFKPTPPEPRVEVGQVWLCAKNKNHYIIKRIKTLEGEVKVNSGEWVKNLVLVTYWLQEKEQEPKEYTRTLEDFLAKFELIN